MRSISRLVASTLAFALGCSAQAVDDFSFGHKGTISPNSFAIPGFSILGEEYVPQLLSDKVILTPPYGGNKKGAIWTENKNTLSNWQIDLDFRVGVTDQGSGSLQFWYAANGKDSVSTSSLYSVGRFDGLVVVVDTVGGKQKIRGFLNDNSVEYRNHQNIESLAFGHCDYTYRNLGEPSHLRVQSTTSGLDVTIDGRPCFNTESVVLPSDYHFGVTAASNDPPDSFEAFKFVLSPATPPVRQQKASWAVHEPNTNQHQQQQAIPQTGGMPSPDPAALANLDRRVNDLYTLVERTNSLLGQQFESLNNRLSQPLSSSPDAPTQAQFASLDARLNDLSRTLRSLESEIKTGDHSKQFEKLSAQVQDLHSGVTEHVPQRLREYVIAHTPRIGFILYSFMLFQTCCIGAWVWYKWRKSTMPKKYL
jgi:lectin, mannose-binding 1